MGAAGGLLEDRLDLVAGAHRNGRLGDDDCKVLDQAGDFLGRIPDVGEIGVGIAPSGGRVQCDEHRVWLFDCLGNVRGEEHPARRAVSLNHIDAPQP